jgi:hypothetical protein
MKRFYLLAAIALIATSTHAVAAEPLAEAELAQLRKVIKPEKDEDPFDKIPWQTDLWAARKKAADFGKPVFLWEMDGHPLGCG